MRSLRQLLNDWDFLDVSDISAHDDEYDCLIGPLISTLTTHPTHAAVEVALRTELENHFGIDTTDMDITTFADKVVTWWTSRATRQRPAREPHPSPATMIDE